jgi:hypothetical protein
MKIRPVWQRSPVLQHAAVGNGNAWRLSSEKCEGEKLLVSDGSNDAKVGR